MPSDSDSGRPDEDTFGVSFFFLPNDLDEAAAKDVPARVFQRESTVNRSRQCVCSGCGRRWCCALRSSTEAKATTFQTRLHPFLKTVCFGSNDVEGGYTILLRVMFLSSYIIIRGILLLFSPSLVVCSL